jgi:ABC-2 type transport system permease protein
VAKNGYSKSSGKISPLGYDKYTRELFGNRDFLVNCVNYLCDDSGLISVRARNVELRLLDHARVKVEELQLNLINVGLPVLLFIVMGLILLYIRKRSYASRSNS